MKDSSIIQPARKDSSDLWAYLFLVFVTIVLLYPVIFSREGSFCIKQDNLHQAYPFFHKLATSLHKGYLPVWDANTYGGKNFSGELQTGIFYPLNILWCLLFGSINGIDVYWLDLLVCLHFLICLFGMYQLARVFRLPPVAAVTTTLVFTFSSAVAARAGGQTCIFFGLTLLPWAILFLSKYYVVRRNKGWLVLAGLTAGLEILAGHMQPFFHTMLISGIAIVFYEWRDRKDWKSFSLTIVVNGLLIGLFAFLIALPQLYYAAEYLSRCYRSVGGGMLIAPGQEVPLPIYAYRFIINLYNLPNLLGQGYTQPEDDNLIYMGILPLALLIIYLVRKKALKMIREHDYLTRLLLIILTVGIFSALGYLTFFCLILYKIPFINAVRQLGRYWIMVSFSAALLAGLAVTYFSELREWLFPKPSEIKLYILLALSVNAVYWIFAQQKDIPISVSFPFLLFFLFLLALMYSKKLVDLDLPMLAVAIICIDLWLNPVSFASTKTPFYASNYYKRNRIYDFLETTYGKYRIDFDMEDYGRVRRNLGDVYTIQTKYGYGATTNRAYFDFMNFGKGENEEIQDLLNVRYILSDKLLDSTNYIFKDSVRHMNLYERRTYYPRVYWKSQLGMKGEAIEEENKGSIREQVYSDGYQRFEVDCGTPDTLIFSENDYPGWSCYDNGKKVAIQVAAIKNYPPLFRSVVLDKGHHLLEFKYNKVFYWF